MVRVASIAIGLALLIALVARAEPTTRVLMIGDSAAFFPYFKQDPSALSAAFQAYGQGLEQWREDGSLALIQKCHQNGGDYCVTASDWDGSEEVKADIRNMLLLFPEIDIVHMSLGLNDLHAELYGHHDEPAFIDALYARTAAHLQSMIDYCLGIRPDVRIVLMGADYGNITEGFGIAEDGSLYSVPDGLASFYISFGWSPETIQEVLAYQETYSGYYVRLEQLRRDIGLQNERVTYVNNLGLLQAHYGIPSLNVPPTYPAGVPGGPAENYEPLPAGYPHLFTPMEAMAEGDALHQSPEGYVKLMTNAIHQVYADWLMDDVGPSCTGITALTGKGRAENPGTVLFQVQFSEAVTGVGRDDFALDTDIPCATIGRVIGGGTLYAVEVYTHTGGGTLRLNLADNGTIYDKAWIPLGKTNLIYTPGNGDFMGADMLVFDGSAASGDCSSSEGERDGEGDGEGEGRREGEGAGEGDAPTVITLCDWPLSGAAIRPDPVNTTASGTASLLLDTADGTYYVNVVHGVLEPTGIFLNEADAGTTGLPLINLDSPLSPVFVALSPADAAVLLDSPAVYLDIKSATHPLGEIRGQVPLDDCIAAVEGEGETEPRTAALALLMSFDTVDADNDGRLTLLEARSILDELGNTVDLFALLDANADGGIRVGELRAVAGEGKVHALDQDADGHISLNELLRLVQFYNAGGYACDPGSEDGYAPGSPSGNCVPHSSDTLPAGSPDRRILLSELLRGVQLFNALTYHHCPEMSMEDGYCTGTFLKGKPAAR